MGEELQPELEQPYVRPRLPVGGFWIRLGAFAIDIALLSVVFNYAAKWSYEFLYPYRWWCQVGGAFVTFVYFWIGSSGLTKGQTLGKMLFGIRVAAVDGGKLGLGKAALRAALVQLIVLAYLFLPQFLTIIGFGILLRLVALNQGILLPFPLTLAVVGLFVVGHLAMAYSLAAAVFCAAGPKRQSLHDLAAGTAVIRGADENRALEFVGSWDQNDFAKRRAAFYSAATITLVVLVLLGMGLIKAPTELKKSLQPYQIAARDLNSPTFRLAYMRGPSEEDYTRFQEALEGRKKEESRILGQIEERKRVGTTTGTVNSQGAVPTPLPPLTTETLHFFPTGRKFLFVFDSNKILNTSSLTSSPDLDKMKKKLPVLAERLSKEYFKDDKGRVAPYTGIQIEFIETLPCYLYSSIKSNWREVIPITGHEGDAAVRQSGNNERSEQQSTQTTGTLPAAGTR